MHVLDAPVFNLKSIQLRRLQLIQSHCPGQSPCRQPHHHVAPFPKSLHWLESQNESTSKLFSVILPAHLLSPNCHHPSSPLCNRSSSSSSSYLTFSRPSVTTHLKLSNRTISIKAPRIWHDLNSFSLPPPVLKITHHHLPLAPLFRNPKFPLTIEVLSLQEIIPWLTCSPSSHSHPDSTRLSSYGAVHKVRHAIFGQFWPPLPLSHFITHPGTPRKYVTHIGPPRFLVGLVQKSRTKVPCTNSISIVRGGVCPFPFSHNTVVRTES